MAPREEDAEKEKQGRVVTVLTGLLHGTLDRPASEWRRGFVARVAFPVVAVVFDAIQLLGLVLPGWDARVVGWLDGSVNVAGALRGSASRSTALYLALAMTGACAAVAAVVAYLAHSHRLRLLPVKLLRVLLPALFSAVYIPLLSVFFDGIACLLPGGPPSGAACAYPSSPIIFGLISAAALVPLVLLAHGGALFFYEADPSSRDWSTAAHGRVQLLYVLLQTVLIALRLVLDELGVPFRVAVFFVAAAMLSLYCTMQPYLRAPMNELRAGLYAAVTAAALLSWVLPLASPAGLAGVGASAAGVLLVVAAGAGGALLCRRTYAAISRSVLRVALRHRDELIAAEAVAAAQAAAAAAQAVGVHAAGGSARGANPGNQTPTSAAGNVLVNMRPSAAVSIQGQTNPTAHYKTMKDLRQPEVGAVDSPWIASRGFWFDACLEVAARWCLERLTAEEGGVEDAEQVYRLALPHPNFADSAYVQFQWAVFLYHFFGDPQAALQEVRRAARKAKEFSDIDLKVLALRRRQVWEQTASGQGSEVNMHEFRRMFDVATAAHNEALSSLKILWASLAKSTRFSRESLATVYKRVATIHGAKKKAQDGYERMLRKFPSSKVLVRCYGLYLRDVINDVESAAYQFARADEIEDQETKLKRTGEDPADGASQAGRSALGGRSQQSGSGSGGSRRSRRGGSSLLKATASNSAALKRLKVGLIGGLCLLAALYGATFGVYASRFTEGKQVAYQIYAVQHLARAYEYFMYYARLLNVWAWLGDAASAEAVRGAMRAALEDSTRWLRGLYLGFADLGVAPNPVPAIWDYWRREDVRLKFYVGAGPLAGSLPTAAGVKPSLFVYKESSPWAAFNHYQDAFLALTSQDPLKLAEPAANNSEWRFILNNGRSAVVASVEAGGELYFAEAVARKGDHDAAVGAMMTTMLIALVILGPGIFRSAFRNVRMSQKGVAEIVAGIPADLISHISATYAKADLVGDGGDSEDEQEQLEGHDAGNTTARSARSARSGGGTDQGGGPAPPSERGEKPIASASFGSEKKRALPPSASFKSASFKSPSMKRTGPPDGTSLDEVAFGAIAKRGLSHSASSKGMVVPPADAAPAKSAMRKSGSMRTQSRSLSFRRAEGKGGHGSGGEDESPLLAAEPAPEEARGGTLVEPLTLAALEAVPPLEGSSSAGSGTHAESGTNAAPPDTLASLLSSLGSDAGNPKAEREEDNVIVLAAREDGTPPQGGTPEAPPRGAILRHRGAPHLRPAALRSDSPVAVTSTALWGATLSSLLPSQPPPPGPPPAAAAAYAAEPARGGAVPHGMPVGLRHRLWRSLFGERRRRAPAAQAAPKGGKGQDSGSGSGDEKEDKISRMSGEQLAREEEDAVLRRRRHLLKGSDEEAERAEGKEGEGEGEGDKPAAAGGEDPLDKAAVEKNALDGVFAALTRRYAVAFLVVGLFAVANAAFCLTQLDTSFYAVTSAHWAGVRRHQAVRLVGTALELYVNDGAVQNKAPLLGEFHTLLDNFTSVHLGLRVGNATMRTPGTDGRSPEQDAIYYGRSECLRLDPALCTPDRVPDVAAVTNGLDFAAHLFAFAARTVLNDHAAYDGEGRWNPAAAEGPIPVVPYYDGRFITLHSGAGEGLGRMEAYRPELDDGFLRSLKLFLADGDRVAALVTAVEAAFFVVGAIFLLLLYLLMFKGMIARLADESSRASQFLDTIPGSCRAQLPAFFGAEDGPPS